MFDNPKKELERLEQQLLAAEARKTIDPDEEFDRLYEDIYEEFGREEPYELDDELIGMLNHTPTPARDTVSRSAGFDAEDYVMDTDRYVAPPKKKSLKGLVIFVLLEAICVIALAVWWLVRTR